MEDHPVFFLCRELLPHQERCVERYFRNRRKSGGGDGGPLRKDHTGVYSLTFRTQKDQHEVLRKKNHVVEVGDCSLEITVTEVSPEHGRSQTDCATAKTCRGSLLSPTGDHYELHVDRFLLLYLKDCEKAENWLHKQLSLLHCTAELHPEDERVVVKRLGTSEETRAVVNWKHAEIKALFEEAKSQYTCHFETDPRKVKSLLEPSCSPNEVKVYSDIGLAVVVGESSHVNSVLDSLTEKCNSNTDHIVWRLGEAKLRLIWNWLENSSMTDKFTKLQVFREEGGRLVLEGNAAELFQADEYIAELDKTVIDRTISDFNPHILTFWKKTIGKPGVFDDLLKLGVEMDIGTTDLKLFSFSSTSLDAFEQALRTQFHTQEVPIADVYLLREKIQPILRKINCEARRVEALASSHNVVYLVGHAKEVKELYKIVEEFEEEMEQGRSLKVSHSLDLNEFCPNASKSSFISRQENDSTHPLQTSPSLLNQDAKVVARYFPHEDLEVLVCLGDITKQEADALVNAANENLKHVRDSSLSLCEAGGREIQMECDVLVEHFGKICTGEAVVTGGGELKCKKLIHAVAPVNGRVDGREKALIQKAVTCALDLCEIMEFTSVALPCVGSGVFVVPASVCAEAIASAVRGFSVIGQRSLKKITLIDDRKKVVKSLKAACDRVLRDMPEMGSRDAEVEGRWEEPAEGALKKLSVPIEAASKDNGRTAITVDIIQGTIETQQVDAVVSPMCGGGPRSTRVGNCLCETVGPQLTDIYSKQERGEMPGDCVMVEGLSQAMFKAVFFVHLLQWDNDLNGTAVEVLRLVISDVLTSCQNQGFTSVSFPILGAGVVLGFPEDLVAQVLLEEIHNFDQIRDKTAPFTVTIVSPLNDEVIAETLKSVRDSLEEPVLQEPKRIILLGKTGSGKSSLANTILEETFFETDNTPNSGTKRCQSKTKTRNGSSFTLIDTPGLFDSELPEEELMPQILSCLTESTPGPHAFLIVLKVEKFTAQEQSVINKICQYFSEEALQYATVVFTNGNQLPPGTTIESFISQSTSLSELVEKCGNRCHVVDNTYWNDAQPDGYRSNRFQVEALLDTVDRMVKSNNWGFYTNNAFKVLGEDIEEEISQIKDDHVHEPPDIIRKEATKRVLNRWLISLAGIGTGAVLGAMFGIEAMVRMVLLAVQNRRFVDGARTIKTSTGFSPSGKQMAIAIGVGLGVGAVAGGAYGGAIGGRLADESDSVGEVVARAKKAVYDTREQGLKAIQDAKQC